jgi:dTMP kinase
VYSFAVKPAVAFYFRVPLEESLRRILEGRPRLKYYEAGLDVGLDPDPYKSFALFQGRILEQYETMVDEFGLTVIDGTLPLVQQQEIVRAIIEPLLAGALRAEPSAWRQVLASESVYGRYLDEVLGRGDEETSS